MFKDLKQTVLKLIDSTVILVRAADMYDWLELKCDFHQWAKDAICDRHLVADCDYLAVTSKQHPDIIFDWIFPLHIAQDIIILSSTEKGRGLRQHCLKAVRDIHVEIENTEIINVNM